MNEPNTGGLTAERGIASIEIWRRALQRWRQGLLASNPFYLASAGFILYGVNRLSSDPGLTGAETSLLSFNFACLFFYEALMVVTAILLARRSIWYDALLLVGLESLFVLIPFSLVSRTVLLNRPLAWAMCGAAVVLALAKFWALKRFIPWLNLSGRLLAMGVIVMAANVGIVLGFQRMEFDKPALISWLNLSWLLLLPLMSALANWLPARSIALSHGAACRWFAETMFALWIAVTAVHLGGSGYVYEFQWRVALLAPTAWVLAWTWVRRSDVLSQPGARLAASALLASPFAVTFLAISDARVFTALNALNCVAYGWCWLWREPKRRVLQVLTLLTLFSVVAGLPANWAARLMSEFDRSLWILLCLAACLPCLAALIRDPRVAIFGAIGTFVVVLCFSKLNAHAALQAGLGFFVAHSLRWPDPQQRGAVSIRILFLLLWVGQSYLWVGSEGANARIGTCSVALVVLALYVFQRWLTSRWGPALVPWCAGAVIFSFPVQLLLGKARTASSGHLSLVAGFVLFALGTWLALARSKWKRNWQGP